MEKKKEREEVILILLIRGIEAIHNRYIF